jgi:hypothetical protein
MATTVPFHTLDDAGNLPDPYYLEDLKSRVAVARWRQTVRLRGAVQTRGLPTVGGAAHGQAVQCLSTRATRTALSAA